MFMFIVLIVLVFSIVCFIFIRGRLKEKAKVKEVDRSLTITSELESSAFQRRPETEILPVLEQNLLGYINKRGGKIILTHCARDLGVSVEDIQAALKFLADKGFLRMEAKRD